MLISVIPAQRLWRNSLFTVISNPPQAVRNPNVLILLQRKISPCGRDDTFFFLRHSLAGRNPGISGTHKVPEPVIASAAKQSQGS
jgi:hypothetical protein